MIRKIAGDIVKDSTGIICHQVNHQGVMGGGVALSIREQLLTARQYKRYQTRCTSSGSSLLGKVMYMKCEGNKVVANMFSQNAFSDANNLTNYEAMEKCFKQVRAYAERRNLPVFIPYRIGCGIAGGNWDRVKNIIYGIFQDAAIDVTIVCLDMYSRKE